MKTYSNRKLEAVSPKNTREIVIEEKNGKPSPREVPRIWRVNPSYRHSNNKITIARIIIIILLASFIIGATYLLDASLQLSISIGLSIVLGFIIVFYDGLEKIRNAFRSRIMANPFESIISYWESNEQSIICFTNKKDLIHNMVQIFRVEEIPENIHASINLFLKSLSEYKNMIKFSYQIVQTPGNYLKKKDNHTSVVKHSDARYTNIYLCINYTQKGILTKNKIRVLKQKILYAGNTLRNNFTSNFHHFKIALLSGENLINALRLYFLKIPVKKEENTIENKVRHRISPNFLIKAVFTSFLLIYIDYILVDFHIPIFYLILIDVAVFFLIIFLWWRELLFIIGKKPFSKKLYIHPFQGTTFFRFRKYSDMIFMLVNKNLLIGLKMFNLAFCFPPAYSRSDKFIQSVMNQKVSFAYTCMNTPLPFASFYKDGEKYLNKHTEFELFNSKFRIQTKIEALNWLSMRSGMWQTFLTLSVHEYEFIDTLNKLTISKLEERLENKAEILRSAFNMNFFNYELVRLRRGKLVSGITYEILKNADYSFNGTHLNYLLFQGKTLVHLIEIVDELKKGIETRIASEFNTPLNLDNYITLGNTINTEVLEEELPFGFLEDQIKNLLVLNGNLISRELFAMKTVSELVKNNIPSLIFDFRGNWSKLIELFKGTSHEKDFLYFKLGSAFTLDPLKSDIPYDKENMDFLQYMFDAYALAFKKHQKTVDMIRNTIMRNPEMDLSSLNLELINQNKWEKSPVSDTLLALFGDFTQQDLPYLHLSTPTSKQSGTITFKDFISNNKTIIVDLSVSNDYTKQIFFTFLIISKIVHYLNYSDDFYEKVLIIPHTDIFFDSFFIDKSSDYGKINKFLDPLLQKRFGIIFLANQAHYLHHNLVSFFNNIIAFNTRDSRDIAAISNVMGLQELQGIGYYSRSRNQTYQFRYLMSMKYDEAVVKRADIYQPFPVQMEWKQIENGSVMEENDLFDYMKSQGYDIRDTEKKILEQSRKTIFQKDLGIYSGFIDEIKQFLEALKTVDQVGNLYEKRVKKELKTFIFPKASKVVKDKAEIKKSRDDIFTLLVKFGYLVEDHPTRASGSESVRTSYSVGSHYDKALDDEFETKQPYAIETLDLEAAIPQIGPQETEHTRTYIIRKKNLKKALAREFSNFLYELFTVYEFINIQEYKNALKVEHNLVRRFLIEVYKHYFNANYLITTKDLTEFVDHLVDDAQIPFNKEELLDFMDRYQIIDFDHSDLASLANEVYEFISIFFDKIQLYMYKDKEE
jgi:hypothetical protein